MSFYFDLTSIGKLYESDCENFADGWISGFFAVYDYWPLFLSFGLFGLTLEHREVFFCIVLKGMLLNGLLNWGFREAINQEGPEPMCSSSAQMPAYASDGLTFLIIVLMISSGMIYGVPIRWFKLSMLWIGGPIALYTRTWLRFNTGPQMLAGCAFGLVEGLIYCLILRYVFTYDRIDRWFLRSHRLGRDYEDTKIRPDRPTLVFQQVPDKMTAKLGSMIGTRDEQIADAMQHRRAHGVPEDGESTIAPLEEDLEVEWLIKE